MTGRRNVVTVLIYTRFNLEIYQRRQTDDVTDYKRTTYLE